LSFPTELPVGIPKGAGGHRNQLNIIADILEVAMDDPIRTHIMYKANLSHKQLLVYLNQLLERGFLAVATDSIDGRTRYTVTAKGIQFLKDYARLNRLLSRE